MASTGLSKEGIHSVETVADRIAESDTQAGESDAHRSPLSKTARRSEAIQKLESMFGKPTEQDEGTKPLLDIAPKKATLKEEVLQDPIEALDALEDAIEEVGKAMPELSTPASPTKKSASKRSPVKEASKKPATQEVKLPSSRQPAKTATRRSSAVLVPRETKASTLRKTSGQTASGAPLSTITNKRMTSQANISNDSKRKPASPKPTIDPAGKRKSSIAALSTPPPAVKSRKPPTKSEFRLPSEGIVAKLKAQKEERQKKQEEQGAAQKRAPAARPAPKSRPLEIRGTASSRGRLSLMAEPKVKTESASADSATTKPVKRMSSINAGVSSASRLSTASLAHRPKSAVISSAVTAQSTATMTSTKRPRPSSTIAAKSCPKPAANLASGTQSRMPSGARPSGKEIFNRDRLERESQQMSVKEKQEAARRAREAAAERGRQASREWAERMKAKKMKGSPSEKDTTEKASENSNTSPVQTETAPAADVQVPSDTSAVIDAAA